MAAVQKHVILMKHVFKHNNIPNDTFSSWLWNIRNELCDSTTQISWASMMTSSNGNIFRVTGHCEAGDLRRNRTILWRHCNEMLKIVTGSDVITETRNSKIGNY